MTFSVTILFEKALYPCIGEDDTSTLCWLPWCGWTRWSSEFGESIFGNAEIGDDKKMVIKRQKSMQDIFKAHRSHYDTRLRKRRQSLPALEEDSVELSTWGVSLVFVLFDLDLSSSSFSYLFSSWQMHSISIKVILILTKFGILISTWFQVVPFGLRFSKQFLFLMYDPSFCCP